MDEIKPVVTEKSQFDCRHESKNLALFRIFWTIRIPMQGPNSTTFHGNSLPLIGSFQLRPWWKKSNNYLWRNEVIENWAFPKLMATFPLYQSMRVLTKGRNAKIFPWNTHLKGKDFDTDLDEKNEACFFMDKKELQLQWIRILFVRFLSVKIPKCYVPADRFSNKLCLFSSRRD